VAATTKIVLASRNAHKVRELAELLAPYDIAPLPQGIELPPEDGSTFAENALTKARAAASATGKPSVADDSGIIVDALHRAPGIRSARYAGENATDAQNLAKLLKEMTGVSDRRAAYVCAIAFVEPGEDAHEVVVEGICEGKLTERPRGDGGFGYDPAFVANEYAVEDLTMAEISQQQKDAISHRGRAARKLLAALREAA
jgi:XTP/dITP diphosphohydrolase